MNPQPDHKKKRRRRHEDDSFMRGLLQKPPNQEKLTSEELKEEVVRNLTTFNSQKPNDTVAWNFKESGYLPANESSYINLFSLNSEVVDREVKDDAEWAEMGFGGMIHELSNIADDKDMGKKKPKPDVNGSITKQQQKKTVQEVQKEKDDEADDMDDEKDDIPEKSKKFINQFTCCERGAQTIQYKTREHAGQTENPVRNSYKDACNQWMIYDAYAEHIASHPTATKRKDDIGGGGGDAEAEAGGGEEHQPEKAKEQKKEDHGKSEKLSSKIKLRKSYNIQGDSSGGPGSGDLGVLLKAVDGIKFMERLVCANVYEDVVDDFKYYEDAADDFRDLTDPIYGSLLPLWKFNYEKAKNLHVTSISWSLSQPDMFAVSYGTFNFVHPVRSGLIVIYTLKSCTYPEFVWTAPNGAMCCHIHPKRNSLVAVGLYDGNVAVLNLEKNEDNKNKTDILVNIPIVLKHSNSVWSVQWGPDDTDGNPTFFSTGMDGLFIQWVVGVPDAQGNGGLEGTQLATFFLPDEPVPGPDGTTYKLYGCGRALAFHPKLIHKFVIGTAEGKIFLCSSNSPSKLDMIFDAHFLPVGALEWNHYHDDVFISCSEDWTIKIWDQKSLPPMYVFEVGIGVFDVCWAPYSSSVFSGITDDGKVLVFDLAVNRERPICNQQAVPKKKVHPHRIQFNPIHPIVVVGDDRSGLITLKMSPNLRTQPKDARNALLEGNAKIEFEINKLKKLLSLVRDPPTMAKGRLSAAKQDVNISMLVDNK